MKLDDMKELFNKVNSDFDDRLTAAEVTVDLAKFTRELERRWCE